MYDRYVASPRVIALATAAALAGSSTAAVVATGGSEQTAPASDASDRPTAVPVRPHPVTGCTVTRSGWEPPRRRRAGRLWVAFGPTGGVYRVPPFNVAQDGSLGVKFAWQKGPGVRGPVTVQARRLDGPAPPVRRRISTRGYGPTGLLASGIAFPTPGCWSVTARAGGATLTFVLLLRAPVTVGCDSRSMARFPGGFTSPRNLVVGPLALQGAGVRTPPSVVREFGGNKFPALVKAGHTVTVEIVGAARKIAALTHGERHADAITFVACRPDQRSGSHADGEPVTFWSGFAALRRPACVPLQVQVDDEPVARPAVIDMGGRGCG